MKKLLFLLIASSFVLSCEKDKPEEPAPPAEKASVITVKPDFDGEVLQLDHKYMLNDTTAIQIVELKFYMSNLTMAGAEKCQNALFNYREKGTALCNFGFPSPATDLSAIIGVPDSQNHSDPSGFPAESVLNPMNANDMYWGWAGGYIFVKIEAKADTIADGIDNFDHPLVYHVATDGFTGHISFSDINWQQNGSGQSAALRLNVAAIFNNPANRIEVRTEHTTPHAPASSGSLTEKVMNNFVEALSVQ